MISGNFECKPISNEPEDHDLILEHKIDCFLILHLEKKTVLLNKKTILIPLSQFIWSSFLSGPSQLFDTLYT